MLAAFKQHTHNDVRIAPGRETHKPSVLSEVFVILMLRAQSQRNDLGRAGLAGDIDSRNVRRGSRAFRQQHPAHRIRDHVPSRGLKRNFFYFRIVRGLHVPLRQVRRINHVRHNHAPIHRNGADRAHQLHRSDRHRALADAHRNRFPGEPLLLEIADLPFFRRHHAAHFVRQVDTSLLPQSKGGRVFCDAIDAKFFRQRIKENIAGLVNRFRQVDGAMASFHPATEAPAIERRAPIAMHVEGLRNPFLPPGRRHNDLERRAGRELGLNRFVQQRLVGIVDQLVPFVP